jgi:proteasome lid subunit RPN8/RPN11
MLELPQAARDAMFRHAHAALPDECCGLLIGIESVVARTVPARNLRSSPTRYLVDPVAHFAAIRAARREGLCVIGAYHSHPTSAPKPSAVDLREAHATGFLYVIVSPGSSAGIDSLGAYRFDGRGFEAVDVVTRPG